MSVDSPLTATGPVAFAVSRLQALTPVPDLRFELDARLGAEAFQITTVGSAYRVVAGDAVGAMYGGCEVAECLAAGRPVVDGLRTPRMAIRALKFNLPWESYRRGPALQMQSEACRDPAFWVALIDHLALCRFNRLSLWSLHPWHLMVKSTEFPESSDLSPEEQARWKVLWNTIIDHAQERGVKVQIFTWNIFVSPAFAKAHKLATYSINGDYIGDGDRSPQVEVYTKSIIAQVLREYPKLAGLGLTQSERMGGMNPVERFSWLERTALAAVRECGRPVELNVRIPHSANKNSNGSMNAETELLARRQLESLPPSPTVYTEIKYNWSHGHSTAKLFKTHGGPLKDTLWNPLPKYRITWMVRNEDFFVLRWCSPGFVNAHIDENDKPWTGGYYTGSESMIPAQILCEKPDRPSGERWQFQRQRLFYAVWGRCLYGLGPNGDFAQVIDGNYGRGVGTWLLPILDAAGQVPLTIATWMNPTWDFTLYSEGFLDQGGFIGLDKFVKSKPMDPAWMGIEEFVAAEIKKQVVAAGRRTPLQIADQLQARSDDVLKRIAAAGAHTGAVHEELQDAAAWAHLGLYVADKLRAGVAYQRLRTAANPESKTEAIAALTRCLTHWDNLITATDRYQDHPLMPTKNLFHWRRYRSQVEADMNLVANPAQQPGK